MTDSDLISPRPPHKRFAGGIREAARKGVAQGILRGGVIVVSAGALEACLWLAYQLRFDFQVPAGYQAQMAQASAWAVLAQMGWLAAFRQFSGIYSYFSLHEARNLAGAVLAGAASLFLAKGFTAGPGQPGSVIAIQTLLSLLALGALRLAWRVVYERFFAARSQAGLAERNVAIIGAGDAGASLAREFQARPRLGLVPVAFFDDDPAKWGKRIHGVPVLGAPESLEQHQRRLGLQEAVIAMPSVSVRRLRAVVRLLQTRKLKHSIVPGVDQITQGHIRVSQLRPVNIGDLLGRQAFDTRPNELARILGGRVVLVTGAGGSIGSELCRQIAVCQPARLLLVEQSEVQLFQIEQELIHAGYGSQILALIADITDHSRMEAILAEWKPSVIYHAAAHKHVGLMEKQPGEAIKNNAFGTADLAELAAAHQVERFVLVSTDKAVNPTSVMGASKRLAEMYLQAFARQAGGATQFAAVRFGNVLGSSGSVVPIFERQIAEGGPVTVTDPNVVRYFMTIPEAAGLVLYSCTQGEGGEIFILDMGKPVKIADLARQMISLSGLQPDRDIEIKYIGLRPGEKLFEELHHLRAHCADTQHPRIKRYASEPVPLARLRRQFAWLESGLPDASADEIKRMLQAIIPEYRPSLGTSLLTHTPFLAGAGPLSGASRDHVLNRDQPGELSPRPTAA